MNQPIRLIALDLDGTLFNRHSRISDDDQTAIRQAAAHGVEVIVSTGRPYAGLPLEVLGQIGVRYAITSNGAAIYRISDKKCIHASRMEPDLVCPIIEELQKKDIHMDAFIAGDGYSQRSCEQMLGRLDIPESIRSYIRSTRTFTDDLAAFVRENHLDVEKMTLNFYPLPDGSFLHREEVKTILAAIPQITFLSGGYHNLEFTRAGTTKGAGLLFLCEYLGIPAAETMACGDTQNDIDILNTAAIGVAMENARDDVKAVASYITRSNDESGVSHAIRHFLPEI